MARPRDNHVSYNPLDQISPAESYLGPGEDDGSSSSSDLLSHSRNVYYEAKERLTVSSEKALSLFWNRPTIAYNEDVLKRRSWLVYWARTFTIVITLLTLLSACVILIGARVQFKRARNAPSTVTYYTTPTVCTAATNIPLAQDIFSTFDNSSVAHAQSRKVVHCGACAHCSNLNDIEKYVTMRRNMTAATYKCAMRGLWRGRAAAHTCMDSEIGFSRQCTDCWLTDIQCSIQNCLIPCLKYKLLREPNNKRDGSLNDCLACDEKLCGPAFIECSGVNRRRLGINSDIGRNDTIESCTTTDFPWLNMTFSSSTHKMRGLLDIRSESVMETKQQCYWSKRPPTFTDPSNSRILSSDSTIGTKRQCHWSKATIQFY